MRQRRRRSGVKVSVGVTVGVTVGVAVAGSGGRRQGQRMRLDSHRQMRVQVAREL